MKCSNRILSSTTAFLVACSLGTATATADVFHGHWIGGRIEETYQRLGGWPTFGDALTPESVSAWNGRFQVFARDSSIYWHPNVDGGTAHQVGGAIRDKWAERGWEREYLGYPTTDELPTRQPGGRFNHFQGGSIYWSPSTGAHNIQGEIKKRWGLSDWEMGPLGFPTTDEINTPGGEGKFNHFQRGSIYWSPSTGAHKVLGEIRNYWGKNGWEKSRFGFPISEERRLNDGAVQQEFQGHALQWVPFKPAFLPTYDSSYGSYNQFYDIFNISEQWTPQALNRELTTHFNQYFTFTGCPDTLRVGDTCNLDTAIGLGAPVRVEAISPDGFTLKSLERHPEGAGRLINFRFVPTTVTGITTIRLNVQAWGPVSNGSLLGPLNSQTIARYSWSRLTRNLRKRTSTASATYITADKNTSSVRTFNVPNSDAASALPDAEVVDTTDYQLSESMDLVPLFPAGTSPEEIEAALKGGSMPTSLPTIREEETLTPSDTTTDSQPDPVQTTQGTEVPE